MSVDALALSALTEEIRGCLLGGRVQDVLAVDELSVGLEVYAGGRRHYLLLSAHPQWARIHISSVQLRRGLEAPPPLILLLRKRLRGGRLMEVTQPAFERIVHLRFRHPQEGESLLVLECMGRHSNILLLDTSGTILECIKRIGPEVNRYRQLLPRLPYVPPPAQAKLPPDQLTAQDAASILQGRAGSTPAWKALVESIQGVSPLLARELCFRAWGRADILCGEVAEPAAFLASFSALLAPLASGDWRPSLGYDSAAEDAPASCFAPYPLTHCARWEPAPSISLALERWLEDAQQQARDPYRAARQRLWKMLEDSAGRLERRRCQLLEQMVPPEEIEALRQAGEYILAFGWQMRPAQDTLEVELGEGEVRRIALDPVLSPAENAERYFERYRKAKRAAEAVPALLEEVEGELAFLEQLRLDVELAASRAELDALEQELVQWGYVPAPAKKPRAKPAPAAPLTMEGPDGFQILVGRNSRQNDYLTFTLARGDDLWFHARGVPGAHVVLRTAGRTPTPAAIQRAAELAAYYSRARQDTQVLVDYTLCRHVRRRAGGRPGQVYYRNETTIAVAPRP
ncbi:MAG: NFACT family protein [Anaerolineae bacterium]|nr:NFACT family protein [Anaerolineae bacterium]